MTRSFAAPCAMVFDVMTRPDYIRRWYGAQGYTVSHCESDLREGGAYRIVSRGPDGTEFGFRGVYRQFRRPHSREYTWIFELMPDKEALVTETFEDKSGATLFTSVLQFATVEDRDGYLATGATRGGAESMDRAEKLLHELQA
jgi:uncharacterized protein YndB with AHSA1/START domain